MRIALLRPLPDFSRLSMNVYHDELVKALKPFLSAEDELILFPPPSESSRWMADLKSVQGKINRYWQHYYCCGREVSRLKARPEKGD